MGFLSLLYDFRWHIAGAVFSYYIIAKIRAYNRLKSFPGPFSTGFAEIWHACAVLSWRSQIWYADVNKKYGMCPPPVVALGSPHGT